MGGLVFGRQEANKDAGKWLETISRTPLSLTADERTILGMVRGMLAETEFAVAGEADGSSAAVEGQRIRALGAAVVRLWAETFRGTQIFDIVRALGRGLEVYGEGVERGWGGGGG